MDLLAPTFGIPVLVPRRADNGRRDEIWELLRDRVWAKSHIVIGEHHEGPFNRSAALNHAASRAGNWECAIVADSDSFVLPGQLTGAVELAQASGRVVIAHSRWVNVDVDETQQLLEHGWLEHRDSRQSYNFTVSSMLVVPRPVWDVVNGFDERFAGWGREDNAFMRAVKMLAESPLRIDGTVYHLAHDRPAEDTHRARSPQYLANDRRWQLYRRLTSAEGMREMVSGNRLAERAA